MNDDRFQGEAAEPPVILRCDYCGAAVRLGAWYFIYENKNICTECAKRFAWNEFETLSQRQMAGPKHWL